jgi:predicted nucleic acid-binding protein
VPKLELYDTSVLVPWIRSGIFEEKVDLSFRQRRFLLCTVVWMELYAGTHSKEDKQYLDRIRDDMKRRELIISPEPDDFYLVGQMLSYYAREFGRIEPRDHANDALIAVCASRSEAALITVNAEHMQQWQRVLRRFKKRLDLGVLRMS